MAMLKPQAQLLARIRHIWDSARTQAARSVNTPHVCANWPIGQQIVQDEQGGKRRAGYGKALLKTLSAQLASEYGGGFSVSALQYMRGFFLGYPDPLENQHAVRVESTDDAAWRAGSLHPGLSWMHYRILVKVDRRQHVSVR